jgi:uncharacterized damage-inducible protein DinB
MAEQLPEYWLRGPVSGVPDQLQPVAHALLQAREEVRALAAELPDAMLWTRPAGIASAGFHLRHMSGVIDRLFTYARGASLDEHQRRTLQAESAIPETPVTVEDLVTAFELQVDGAVESLRKTDESTLSQTRTVGRLALPSTVRGLLFHAAEHVQRHLGQLLVTIRVQNTKRAGIAPRAEG